MPEKRKRTFGLNVGHRLKKARGTKRPVSSRPIRECERREKLSQASARLQIEEAIEHVNSIKSQLHQEIHNLKLKNRLLMDRIDGLERRIERRLEEASAKNEHEDTIAFNGEMNSSFALSAKLSELDEKINQLTQKIVEIEDKNAKIQGKKTSLRISKIEDILKESGGSQSFKQLQSDLGLSPSQFTYLLRRLDTRYIEVKRCPGSQRGEKMLILK